MDYASCQRYFYWKHRQHQELGPRVDDEAQLIQAAPTVGVALHAYIAGVIQEWMDGGRALPVAMDRGAAAFATDMGAVNPQDYQLLEREALAQTVLALWAPRQWARFERGDELPLAVEWDVAIPLPAETECGPILPHLRTYTARLDYVYERGTPGDDVPMGSVCVVDSKSTSATAPKSVVRDYLMSDQHLGYVYAQRWAQAQGRAPGMRPADAVMYSMLRLHTNIASPHTFYEEPRFVNEAQLADWWERMLAQRVQMSAQWERPRVAWVANTSPSGPCIKYGKPCEYSRLCKRPNEVDFLLDTQYRTIVEEDDDAGSNPLVSPTTPTSATGVGVGP